MATGRQTKRQQQERRATLRPSRRRDDIVDVMRSYGRPISPMRLSKATGATLGSVAYHVRTLLSAGVIELADEGRVRGAVEHFYALAPNEEDTWLTDPVRDLQSLCGALTVPAEDGDYPQLVVLDDQGRAELRAVVQQLRPKVQSIVRSAVARAAG